MTVQEIIALTQAGFSKADIMALNNIQPTQQLPQAQTIQQTQQLPQAQTIQQTQQLPQAQTIQQTQQLLPTQLQQNPQPELSSNIPMASPVEDVTAILQRINAATSNIDIPPARTTNDIIADRFTDLMGGTPNNPNGGLNNGK